MAETLITGAPLLKESHEDVGGEPVKGGGCLWDKGTELREGPGAAPPPPRCLPGERGPAGPPCSGPVWPSVLIITLPSFLASLLSGLEGLQYPGAFISG